MNNKSILVFIFLVLFINSSCNLARYNVKKSIVKNKSTKTEQLKRFLNNLSSEERKKWYIRTYSDLAVSQMKKYKIPASITLAQGLLESGAGASTLAINANNHFGIKCHQDWSGKKIFHDDDEKNECFRKYKNPLQSYIDHSEFLTTRGRYSFLFRYSIKNYIKWSHGLKKAGYATDPRYAEKLIDIIENYDLWKFDGSKKPLKKVKKKNNKAEKNQYVVKKGDTLYSIAKKYKVSVDELIKKNNLKSNNISIGQKLKI
tara:strand:- start:1125 stop:1901 length:777 start_codon:yes stop_codon:yes gene_type:complete